MEISFFFTENCQETNSKVCYTRTKTGWLGAVLTETGKLYFACFKCQSFFISQTFSDCEQWLGIHVGLGISLGEGKCKLQAPDLQLSGAPQLILDLAATFYQGFLIPELRAWSHKVGRCPPAARRAGLSPTFLQS